MVNIITVNLKFIAKLEIYRFHAKHLVQKRFNDLCIALSFTLKSIYIWTEQWNNYAPFLAIRYFPSVPKFLCIFCRIDRQKKCCHSRKWLILNSSERVNSVLRLLLTHWLLHIEKMFHQIRLLWNRFENPRPRKCILTSIMSTVITIRISYHISPEFTKLLHKSNKSLNALGPFPCSSSA